MKLNNRVFIINAKRSAIGKFLGSFYESDIADVSAQVIKKGFRTKDIESVEKVILGNVFSAGLGQGIARKIAVLSGIPEHTPAYTVNMVCGSGMQAILNGCMEIQCGLDLVLCGGIEFMSNIPYATNSYIRLGKKFGDFTMTDLMIKDGLTDAFSGNHMGITAENIAQKYSITREEQDEYSWMSLNRAIKAIDGGKFVDEIVPVELCDYRGRKYVFKEDEFPNRESSPEKIHNLKTTFIKDGNGTITPASASGINDGVAFVMLASEKYCLENDIKPLAEIIDGEVVGCDPQFMGLGPYYAITKLLHNSKLPFEDIDVLEVNEAFAAQILGSYKLLAKEFNVTVDQIIEKSNIYGSGLGLGHPLGMTGVRITTTLTSIMRQNNLSYGVASLCIGGGMGAAILLRGCKDV